MDLGDVVTCTVVDGQKIAADMTNAVHGFEQRSIAGISTGLEDIADALIVSDEALKLCTSPKDVAQYKALLELLKTFKSPSTFVSHLTKDIEVNGVDILKHVEGSVTDFKAGEYEAFGKELGDALAEVSIGTKVLQLKAAKT